MSDKQVEESRREPLSLDEQYAELIAFVWDLERWERVQDRIDAAARQWR